MTPRRLSLTHLVPYFGLVFALALAVSPFFLAERYRRETETLMGQVAELQWRVSQAREHVVRAAGYLQLAHRANYLNPDITRQLRLIDADITLLLALPKIEWFFTPERVSKIDKLNQQIQKQVLPAVADKMDLLASIAVVDALEREMVDISGAAVNHIATLHETANAERAISRNWYIFGTALAVLAMCVFAVQQRHSLNERHNKQLRSLAILYQHMTHTRISGLRMFVESIRSKPPSPLLLQAADATVTELESINGALLNIASARRDFQTAPLGDVLDQVKQDDTGVITFVIGRRALEQPVPAMLFRLMLNELVANAKTAIENIPLGRIVIRADVKTDRLWGIPHLEMEVTDNGKGMSPDVLNKATTPFFSTKSGRHVGLGLTSCAEIVQSLHGSFWLDSTLNKGTMIRIHVPIA